MRHYIELTKPRITWLILMSTAVGYFFGMKHAWRGLADWLLMLNTLVGTGLIASGTAALNQWYERHADGLMRRTAGRPIPSGRLTANRALWFGIGLVLAGFTELVFGVNPLTGILGALTMGSYLFLYTPLKQRSHLSTVIGALPGAMPPLMGYAASYGALNREAWTLFAILFVWQFPHFMSIAWLYREDYGKAGIRMLPVVHPDGVSTVVESLLFAVLMIPVSLIPWLLGMTGTTYAVLAIALGLVYLAYTLRFTRILRPIPETESRMVARDLLKVSVLYLPLLFTALMLCATRIQ